MNRFVLCASPKIVKKWKETLVDELQVQYFDEARDKVYFFSFLFYNIFGSLF